MNANLVALALREVVEAKDLLRSLITSSEQFDYPKAKSVLKTLRQKIRALEKLQAGLESEVAPIPKNVPNICVLDFRSPSRPAQQNPKL